MSSTQFENLYNNDTLIKNYVSNNNIALLDNIKLYNNTFKTILSCIKEKLTNQYATINIYDNDTGLLGWCLAQYKYTVSYKRSSNFPMHAVYINSMTYTTNTQTTGSLDNVNVHFITTMEDYKQIDFKSNKNVIFAIKSFDKKLKFHKTPYYQL
jgi:hypothetical protein